MVGGAARALAAAAVISAALLVQVVPARALEEESCVPAPAAGGELIQKARRETSVATEDGQSDLARAAQNQSDLERAEAELEAKYATTTSFCRESDDRVADCWSRKPPSSTAACTADSGTAACRCADTDCRIDNLDAATPTTGRCEEKAIYELGGELHRNAGTGAFDVVATGQEVYCTKMVKNDRWKAKHLVKLSSDPRAANGKPYWQCWHPNKWWNGKCQRKTRYLGESCWTSRAGSGRCAGDTASYDEYSTSCYENKCTPYAWASQRQECQCTWFGWNFLVACTAKNNLCGGHACVLSTGSGKFYCDYATSADW